MIFFVLKAGRGRPCTSFEFYSEMTSATSSPGQPWGLASPLLSSLTAQQSPQVRSFL